MTDNPEPHAYVFENDIEASAAPLGDSVYCMGEHRGIEYSVHSGNGERRGIDCYSVKLIGQNRRFERIDQAKAFIDGYLFAQGEGDGHADA